MKKSLLIMLIIAFFIMTVYVILEIVLYKTTFNYNNQEVINYTDVEREFVTLNTGEQVDMAFAKKEDKVVFVYFHGNVGRLDFIIDFLKHNYSFVSPAYPGYAKSSGKPSVKNIYETVEKTKQFVRKNFPDKKIYVLGHSLGSQSAFYYGTLEDKIKTLSIVEGFDSIYEMCKGRLKLFSFLCFMAKDSFNAKKLARKTKLPFTFISFHSPEDKTVPFTRGLNLYNKVNAKKKIFFNLQEGEHGYFDPQLITDITITN